MRTRGRALAAERASTGPADRSGRRSSTGRPESCSRPASILVTTANCSVAHAEMVAIMVAQKAVGDFDLGGPGRPHYELVASTEPCAMCYGATPWSGVRGLVIGARGEDAEAVGFDEGTKPSDWTQALEERGISVTRDVLREEAASVLREYAASEGEIYNSRGEGY